MPAANARTVPHRVIDTNVPLAAAGENDQASDECQERCELLISQIIKGEIVPCIDEAGDVLAEYRNNMYPNPLANPAGSFLLYVLLNRQDPQRIRQVTLQRDNDGAYLDYPDPDDSWTTDVRRCERFDADDKKWVAIARRFKLETGQDAPIVNAADRCWRAFEAHLNSAGVALDFLCVTHPSPRTS